MNGGYPYEFGAPIHLIPYRSQEPPSKGIFFPYFAFEHGITGLNQWYDYLTTINPLKTRTLPSRISSRLIVAGHGAVLPNNIEFGELASSKIGFYGERGKILIKTSEDLSSLITKKIIGVDWVSADVPFKDLILGQDYIPSYTRQVAPQGRLKSLVYNTVGLLGQTETHFSDSAIYGLVKNWISFNLLTQMSVFEHHRNRSSHIGIREERPDNIFCNETSFKNFISAYEQAGFIRIVQTCPDLIDMFNLVKRIIDESTPNVTPLLTDEPRLDFMTPIPCDLLVIFQGNTSISNILRILENKFMAYDEIVIYACRGESRDSPIAAAMSVSTLAEGRLLRGVDRDPSAFIPELNRLWNRIRLREVLYPRVFDTLRISAVEASPEIYRRRLFEKLKWAIPEWDPYNMVYEARKPQLGNSILYWIENMETLVDLSRTTKFVKSFERG